MGLVTNLFECRVQRQMPTGYHSFLQIAMQVVFKLRQQLLRAAQDQVIERLAAVQPHQSVCNPPQVTVISLYMLTLILQLAERIGETDLARYFIKERG